MPRLSAILSVFLLGCATVGQLPTAAIEHNTKGAQLLAAGKLNDAQSRFHLALEYHPHFSEAHANLGLVALQRGNLPQAKEHLLAAIRLNEDFAEARSNLGVVFEALGSPEKAKSYYVSALAIDPGMTNARRNVSRLLIETGDFVSARAHLMRLVQIESENSQSQSLLAYAEVRLNRAREGERRANKVLASKPNEPIARVARAIAKMHRSNFDGALVDLNVAKEDELVGLHARIRIGTCLAATGRSTLAQQAIDALLGEAPQNPAVQLLAGYQAWAMGMRDSARTHAQAALRLSPNLPAAKTLLAKTTQEGL